MDTGQLLTRATIWLALTLYVGSEIVRAGRRGGQDTLARALNTAGCAAFLAHVACAFQFYHHWSHAAAYADTARQTEAYFGWRWGGGLYFNYAFLLLWLGQVIAAWTRPFRAPPTSAWWVWVTRGFILLMIVNGAVVFARGPIRWFGLLLCLALGVCWWRRTKSSGQVDSS